MMRFSALCSGLLVAGLSACGGGSGEVSEGTPQPGGANLPPPSQSQLLSQAAEMEVSTIAPSGTVVPGSIIDGERIEGFGAIAGVIVDASSGEVALDNGGAARLLNLADTDHMLLYITDEGDRGLIGTPVASFPSGLASYNGVALVDIRDESSLWELEGDALVRADFRTNAASVAISELRGTRVSPSGVTGITGHSAQISGAALDGAEISGGTLSVSGDTLGSPDFVARLRHSGAIFGPGGEEVGGNFTQDETGAQRELRIDGSYAAK